MAIVLVMIIAVLLFTSKTYMEVPVMLMTFGMAALLNMGTNFLPGEISFVSNSIAVVLQLALAIDYAIVISSRYSELKSEMSPKEAIVETLNQTFPTIITSGHILSVAGLLIGFMSSDVAISAVGECLGRGTLISIGLVMCVLPQILLLGDTIIEKTSFTLKKTDRIQHISGFMRVKGHVRGYVSGIVDADISGIVHVEIIAQLDSENAVELRERVDGSITQARHSRKYNEHGF